MRKYGFLFSVQEPAAVPGIDFHALRTRVRIADVLRLLQFVPSRTQGDQVRGPCPIHRSASPRSRSFSAHLGKNTYRCFACGSAGNQLDLWAAATKQPLYEAAIDLGQKLHVPVPRVRGR
jgi:DNA primase